jgi:hypothetical protein
MTRQSRPEGRPADNTTAARVTRKSDRHTATEENWGRDVCECCHPTAVYGPSEAELRFWELRELERRISTLEHQGNRNDTQWLRDAVLLLLEREHEVVREQLQAAGEAA